MVQKHCGLRPALALALAALLIAGSLAGCAVPFGFDAEGEAVAYKHLPATAAAVDADAARKEISAYRQSHGLGALVTDPALSTAAAKQAKAMATADVMSHTVDGSLMARLAAVGVDPRAAAENVSAGYMSLNDAIVGWRQSPAHNANLLDPAMRRMGIASAYAPGSKYKQYWSLILSD